MREAIDLARRYDREINAARTAEELRDAVHERRLVRAGLEFEQAMEQYERENPVPVLVDRFPVVIR